MEFTHLAFNHEAAPRNTVGLCSRQLWIVGFVQASSDYSEQPQLGRLSNINGLARLSGQKLNSADIIHPNPIQPDSQPLLIAV